jgi:hypothetical protein
MNISQFEEELFNKMYKSKTVFKEDNVNIEQIILEFKDNNDFFIQHECEKLKTNKVIIIYEEDVLIVEGSSIIKKQKNNIIQSND